MDRSWRLLVAGVAVNYRRRSLLKAALAGIASGRSSAAAPAGKHIIVGALSATSEPKRDGTTFVDFFLRAMQQRGYVEGKNLAYEGRYADNHPERLDAMAAELVAKKVDVIVAAGTPPTLAAHKATKLIPIISVGGASPVNLKLAATMARPGGNVTGVPSMGSEVFLKGMEILRRLVPSARRIGWLMNPDNPASQRSPAQLAEEGKQHGVELVGIPYREPADLDRELGGARKGRVDALYIRVDSKLNVNAPKIAAFALASRIPAVGSVRQFVPAGGLASYGQSYDEQWNLVVEYVDKIANGAKPADLPIIQPTKFELYFNRKTAAALGITIPQDLLLRAELVVD